MDAGVSLRQVYSAISDSLKPKDKNVPDFPGNHFVEDIPSDYLLEESGVTNTLSSPEEVSGSFSIIPRVYELKLDRKYGITLAELKNGKKSKFQGDSIKTISFNGAYKQSVNKIEDRILRKYESVPDFCSMRIDTGEELLEHVRFIHEMSYNHYVWAKENDLESTFPILCCGSSSRNLFLTLMDKGYPNSSLLRNKSCDHSYVGLPFVFGKANEKGFIIVDPTSDQLFHHDTDRRNYLFVVFGTEWDYETDWAKKRNLYPRSVDDSRFSNLHTLKCYPSPVIYQSNDIDKYFSNVFENPVNVAVDSF